MQLLTAPSCNCWHARNAFLCRYLIVKITELDGDKEVDYGDVIIGEAYKTDHFATEAIARNAYNLTAVLGLSAAGNPVVTRRRNIAQPVTNVLSVIAAPPTSTTIITNQPLTPLLPSMIRFATKAARGENENTAPVSKQSESGKGGSKNTAPKSDITTTTPAKGNATTTTPAKGNAATKKGMASKKGTRNEAITDISKWTFESWQGEWTYRIRRRRVPSSLKTPVEIVANSSEDAPIVLVWARKIDANDKTTWPPSGTTLGDNIIYNVVNAGIQVRDRGLLWTEDFNLNGDILRSRPNRGRAATIKAIARTSEGNIETTFDLVYKEYYSLQGDRGAAWYIGNNEKNKKPWVVGKPNSSAQWTIDATNGPSAYKNEPTVNPPPVLDTKAGSSKTAGADNTDGNENAVDNENATSANNNTDDNENAVEDANIEDADPELGDIVDGQDVVGDENANEGDQGVKDKFNDNEEDDLRSFAPKEVRAPHDHDDELSSFAPKKNTPMPQKNDNNSDERGLVSYDDLVTYECAIVGLLADTLDVGSKTLERISKFANNAAKQDWVNDPAKGILKTIAEVADTMALQLSEVMIKASALVVNNLPPVADDIQDGVDEHHPELPDSF